MRPLSFCDGTDTARTIEPCMDNARPWIPVILGGLGITFLTVFWAITGRIEPSLLALFGSLVGLSEGVNALRDLRQPPSPPPRRRPKPKKDSS